MGACLCPARRLRAAAAARRGRRVCARLHRREPHALHVARRRGAGICRERRGRKRDDRPVRRRAGLCAGRPAGGPDPRQPRDQGPDAATGGGRLPARRRRGPQPPARARCRRAGCGGAGPAGGGAWPLGALMALRTAQPNFSKGVISDELVARIDVAAYASGLKRAENVIILKYGGVTKRPAANGGLVIEDRLTITDLTPGVSTTVEAAFHDYEIGEIDLIADLIIVEG